MASKVLIVGGGGFIGSWLTKQLLDTKHKVVIIDPFVYYADVDVKILDSVLKFRTNELLKGARIIKSAYEKVGKGVLKNFKPDVVIHLAATPIEGSKNLGVNNRLILHDIPLTYKLAQDIAKSDVSKFIYMSSIFAYGNYTGWSVSENVELSPHTLYGISKATGEFIIRSLLDHKSWVILRTTSVYGFGDANLRASQIFVNNALDGKSFWVNKDSWPDFIYVKDLVAGLEKVVDSDLDHEVLHISGGHAIPLTDFVKELSKHFPKLDYEIKENVDDRPRRGTMDNTKARVILSWGPKFTLSRGIKDYLSYARKAKHG